MNQDNLFINKIKVFDMFHSINIEWNLKDDVNILGGKNGSGKSTILKCVFDILKNGMISSEKLKSTVGNICITLNNGYEFERIPVNEFDKYPDYDHEYGLTNLNTADGWMYLLKHPKIRSVAFEKKIKAGAFPVIYINSFEQIVANAKSFELESTLKDNEKTFLDILIEKELNNRNALFANTFAEILHGLSNGENILASKDKPKVASYFDFYKSINRFMKEYASEIGNNLSFTRDHRDNDKIPFTRLSMGEKQLLLILLMAHNTAKEKCVFIMDEPDLGMHIEWKEKLVKELRHINPNMQLILSTHSPSVIEGWFDKVMEISQISR